MKQLLKPLLFFFIKHGSAGGKCAAQKQWLLYDLRESVGQEFESAEVK
jgi:hypothetical protein